MSQAEEEIITFMKENLYFYSYTEKDYSVYDNILFVCDDASNLSQYASDGTYVVDYIPQTDRNSVTEFIEKSNFTNVKRVAFAFHGPVENATHDNITIPMFMNMDRLFTEDDLTENQTTLSDNVQFMHNMITTLSLEHVDFLACNTLLHDKYKSYFSWS